MKAISKSALVLLCFVVLPGLSVFASPPGNENGDEDKPVIIAPNIGWLQVRWILPPRIGDDLFYWLDKAFAESMGYTTDSEGPPSEEAAANPFRIFINKGVMSGNPG